MKPKRNRRLGFGGLVRRAGGFHKVFGYHAARKRLIIETTRRFFLHANAAYIFRALLKCEYHYNKTVAYLMHSLTKKGLSKTQARRKLERELNAVIRVAHRIHSMPHKIGKLTKQHSAENAVELAREQAELLKNALTESAVLKPSYAQTQYPSYASRLYLSSSAGRGRNK